MVAPTRYCSQVPLWVQNLPDYPELQEQPSGQQIIGLGALARAKLLHIGQRPAPTLDFFIAHLQNAG
jgi:hypothetical protein